MEQNVLLMYSFPTTKAGLYWGRAVRGLGMNGGCLIVRKLRSHEDLIANYPIFICARFRVQRVWGMKKSLPINCTGSLLSLAKSEVRVEISDGAVICHYLMIS